MALATNAFTSYSAVGNREDLTDVIYNIDPTETPFLTSCGRTTAKVVLHEWQTDALADADADNAVLEGDDVTPEASTPTTREQNYCQISRKSVAVSGTQQAVDKAGRASELAYQKAKRGKELRRDMETIVTGNQGLVAGDASTARKLRSLESWLSSNASRNTGAATPGADAAASTDPATDASETRAFTETLLKEVLQSVWTGGGMLRKLMVGPYNKTVVSGFTGRSSARQNVDKETIQAAAHIYASDFGEVEVVANRFSRERSAIVFDPEYAAIAYLRPIKYQELARTGDSERGFMLAEYTLQMKNEKAHGVVADLDTEGS